MEKLKEWELLDGLCDACRKIDEASAAVFVLLSRERNLKESGKAKLRKQIDKAFAPANKYITNIIAHCDSEGENKDNNL